MRSSTTVTGRTMRTGWQPETIRVIVPVNGHCFSPAPPLSASMF
jgi:hypothetical protein